MLNTYHTRLAQPSDLAKVLDLIHQGRALLKEQGSPQWQDGNPTDDRLAQDIDQAHSYVFTVNGQIAGTAALIIGPDPAYQTIYDGSWDNTDATYATIHRISISADYRGQGLSARFMQQLISIAQSKGITHIRIDTHALNKGMQHIIQSLGFSYRGIVYVAPNENGRRLAYELSL